MSKELEFIRDMSLYLKFESVYYKEKKEEYNDKGFEYISHKYECEENRVNMILNDFERKLKVYEIEI